MDDNETDGDSRRDSPSIDTNEDDSIQKKFDVDEDSGAVHHELRIDTSLSNGTLRYRTSSPLIPGGKRYVGSPERSPARKPATPLRGIGRYLQHRRRDASPDSPSVRADLLSGSVVAGLVATAIEEVEASAPHPEKNKPMADLVERAVKAEFKVNQLEHQKMQLWDLVRMTEDELDQERGKQLSFVGVMLLMIGVEGLLLVYTSYAQAIESQKFIGSLLAVHVSMCASTAVVLRGWCFPKRADDETDEDEDASEADAAADTPSNEITNQASRSPVRTSRKPVSEEDAHARETQATEDLKEAIALLPLDQRGLDWIRSLDDSALLCFLRGHLLSVSKAFKYIVKCSEWRIDYGADTLVSSWENSATKSATLLKQTFPASYLGNTPDGTRVYLFRMAMCDFPGYFRSCAAEDVTRHTLYLFEKHRIESKWKPGILIVDLGADDNDENKPVFSVGQLRSLIAAGMQYVSTMTKVCDPYYPEMFSKIYLVRTPVPFWATWRVAQLLIPVRTREKISFLGFAETEETLSSRLPVSCIPDFLGGEADTSSAPKGGIIVTSAASHALKAQ